MSKLARARIMVAIMVIGAVFVLARLKVETMFINLKTKRMKIKRVVWTWWRQIKLKGIYHHAAHRRKAGLFNWLSLQLRGAKRRLSYLRHSH